jgi:hypothetical protein
MLVHMQATLAYFETNRETIAAEHPWWLLGRSAVRPALEPAAAAVKEEPARVEKRQETLTVQDVTTKPKWSK